MKQFEIFDIQLFLSYTDSLINILCLKMTQYRRLRFMRIGGIGRHILPPYARKIVGIFIYNN